MFNLLQVLLVSVVLVGFGTGYTTTNAPTIPLLTTPKHPTIPWFTTLKHKENPWMPSSLYCGFQYRDNRYGGLKADDEFPWLVDVLCNKDNYDRHYLDRCSGVLINDRYVLTSSRCGIYAEKVRLGTYNSLWTYSNSRVGPTDVSYWGIGDATSAEFIAIEKFLVFQENSVALLRLSRPVVYSDRIRPICLRSEHTWDTVSAVNLSIPGWNFESSPYHQENSVNRKILKPSVSDSKNCYEKVQVEETSRGSNQNYVCMYTSSYMVCGDDQGGPIMHYYKHQWYVVGVINSVQMDSEAWCMDEGYFDGIKINTGIVEWVLENIHD